MQDTEQISDQESAVQEGMPHKTGEAPSTSLDISPERSKASYDLGLELLRQRFWEEAADVFRELILRDPGNEEALKKLDEATEKASRFRNLETFYRVSQACLEKEQWDVAIVYLRRIDESGEKYKDAATLYAEANKQLRLQTLYAEVETQLKKEKWAEAVETLEEIVRIDLGYKEAKVRLDHAKEQHRLQILYEEALGHLRGKRWTQAIKVLEGIPDYRDTPDRLKEAQKQQKLAKLYTDALGAQEVGHWGEAINKYREIIYEAGFYEDATRRLDQAQGQLQQELAVRLNRGEKYLRQRRWKEAAAEFERVYALDSNYRSVRARLQEVNVHLHPEELRRRGEASLQTGRWREAVEIFEELHKSDPTDESIATNLDDAKEQLELDRLYRKGGEYFRKGKWGKASRTFERIVGLKPDYRDAPAKQKVAQERLSQSGPLVRFLNSPQVQGFANAAQVIAFIVAAIPVVIGLVIAVPRIVGSVVATPTPKPSTLCNGTFDDKFECWEHGGELGQDVRCEEGQCYAVLGNPDYMCEGGVPVGEAWIKQSFQVLQTVSPTLSLRYRVFSYDLDIQDSFQVRVNGNPVGQFGNSEWNESSCNYDKAWDSGWQTAEFDLGPYMGEGIEVLLRNVNATYEWWNTWTYVDDVEVR